jgi:dynein heavy chain
MSHGAQQEYIWSFVAGFAESSGRNNCPCSTMAGTQPPTHIGDNYFCESGNQNNGFEEGRIYSGDRLWDGEQCEGRCCEGTQSPPWFSVQLPAPTTDMIEVSICCDQGTEDEDTPVELIEIYVQ